MSANPPSSLTGSTDDYAGASGTYEYPHGTKSFTYRHESPVVVLQSPPGSNDNGAMEARIAKLESAVEFIQRDIADIKTDVRSLRADARVDFRTLFGALIVVAVGLAGILAKGFGWL